MAWVCPDHEILRGSGYCIFMRICPSEHISMIHAMILIISTLHSRNLLLQCANEIIALSPEAWFYVFLICRLCTFLDAFLHLYKRVCPSVRPSVRRLVILSVTQELKPCKRALFDQNYYQFERERILCRVSGLVHYYSRQVSRQNCTSSIDLRRRKS